jgi:predicted dehydrogenase
MEKVRWGLLSTANINRRLIPAIRASARGELIAVASRNPVRAQSYAAEWEIPRAFGSYEEMLESDSIDCIYNGLPNHLHAEWSIKAMQAGKHVLCEKPFALSLVEVDQMIAASQKHARIITEAFMYRHHPQTKLAGEWVHSGQIGEPIHFYGLFHFNLKDQGNVRLYPEFGGGCLWDIGVYPMSLAQYLFSSPPEWVFGDQSIGASGVDESFSGMLHYPGRKTAQIFASFRSEFNTYAEIIGTAGRLTFSEPFVGIDRDGTLTYTPNPGESRLLPVTYKELYTGEIEDMHAAILDSQPPYLSLDETRNHIRTILALYQSAQTGKPVSLT